MEMQEGKKIQDGESNSMKLVVLNKHYRMSKEAQEILRWIKTLKMLLTRL